MKLIEMLCEMVDISIHAPREGLDAVGGVNGEAAAEFQSTRPARGATPSAAWRRATHFKFQSTRPARGATMQEACLS